MKLWFTSDGKGITDSMASFGFVNKFLSIFIEFMTVALGSTDVFWMMDLKQCMDFSEKHFHL